MIKSRQVINLRTSVKNTATDGRNTLSTTRTLEYRISNVCVEFCRANHINTLNCRIIPGLPVCFRTTEMFIYKEQIIPFHRLFPGNLLIFQDFKIFYAKKICRFEVQMNETYRTYGIEFLTPTG